jgi:hypothetical protein
MKYKTILRKLQNMDARKFEYFVAKMWRENGYTTKVTQSSRDGGVDVIAVNREEGEKHLIQAKRYAEGNKVGSAAIQQYSSLYIQHSDVTAVYVVTTSSFTKNARKVAKQVGVKLMDGRYIARGMAKSNSGGSKAKQKSGSSKPKQKGGSTGGEWKDGVTVTRSRSRGSKNKQKSRSTKTKQKSSTVKTCNEEYLKKSEAAKEWEKGREERQKRRRARRQERKRETKMTKWGLDNDLLSKYIPGMAAESTTYSKPEIVTDDAKLDDIDDEVIRKRSAAILLLLAGIVMVWLICLFTIGVIPTAILFLSVSAGLGLLLFLMK